jgi:hypothetical protein
MAQNDPAVMDDKHAQAVLDVHFSMSLGCTVADLRRPGWTIVPTRDEADPAALLFGERTLVSLLSPASGGSQEISEIDASPAGAGVALVASELWAPVTDILRAYSPMDLFSSYGLALFRQLITRLVPESMPAHDEAHMRIYYVTRSGYIPYSGHWQEWIEPLAACMWYVAQASLLVMLVSEPIRPMCPRLQCAPRLLSYAAGL